MQEEAVHSGPPVHVSGKTFNFGRSIASSLFLRLGSLASLLLLELILLSLHLDTDRLGRRVGLVGYIAEWGPDLLRIVFTCVFLYAGLAFFTARDYLRVLSARLASVPISLTHLGGHFCSMAAFVSLSFVLFQETSHSSAFDGLAIVWLITGIVAGLLGACAFIPLRIALHFLHLTRTTAAMAAVGSHIAFYVGTLSDSAWETFSGITFEGVATVLGLFHSNLIVDSANLTLGTQRFQVTIVSECSGFQGAGLMIVFGCLWMWLFRRECLPVRALVLIPVGVLLMFALNCFRIAALILIGDAGAERIAMGGFHSQAGWIAFNVVALGYAFVLQRVSWVRKPQHRLLKDEQACSETNPTAWYLAPFLSVLAAAMVSRALADGFEWIYPLRFFAAAVVLWHFRRRYAELDWRSGWSRLIAGVVVAIMWVALDWTKGPAGANGIAEGVASLSKPLAMTWITFRALASAATVPVVEELAFRGFLLRRLTSADFQQVTARSSTVLAICLSSILFGILHGDRWVAGTIAGVIYALAYRSKNRFGDAVVAHSVTNGMLTVWVLFTGNWQLW